MRTSVEWIEEIKSGDLADLCAATEEAITNGIGFDWVVVPVRETLEKYWRGVLLVPERQVMIGRLDGSIAAACQLVKPAFNNEAGAHNAVLTTFFVAPWARGQGLARDILEAFEARALELGFTQVSLDVRETQEAALKLFESTGYQRWGIKERYAQVDGKYVRGFFHTKTLDGA